MGRYKTRQETRAEASTLPQAELPEVPEQAFTQEEVERYKKNRETIDDARARRARGLADQVDLQNQKARMELVQIDLVNAHFAGVFARLQDILRKLGSETRDALAAETDPIKCQQLVDLEIERALAELKPLVLKIEGELLPKK